MENYRTEAREATQQWYGGYCSYVRSEGYIPIPYHKFSDRMNDFLMLTKKERKAYWLKISEKDVSKEHLELAIHLHRRLDLPYYYIVQTTAELIKEFYDANRT